MVAPASACVRRIFTQPGDPFDITHGVRDVGVRAQPL